MNRLSLLCGLALATTALAQTQWVAFPQSPDPVTLNLPVARTGHVLVPISATKMFVHGGQTNTAATTARSDAWIYDLTNLAWTQLSPSGVAPQRTQHMAAYDSARNKVVVYGGVSPTNNYDGAIFEYDVATNAWATITTTGGAPGGRNNAAFEYDPIGNRIVMQGGAKTPFPNCRGDTWEYRIHPVNGPTWTQLIADAGAAGAGGTAGDCGLRWVHRMVFDSARKRMVMYGGSYNLAAGGVALRDTWEFHCDPVSPNFNTWVQVSTATTPGGATWYGMGYDAHRRRTVVFGGNNFPGPGAPNTPSSEVAEFDGTNWTIRTVGGASWQNQYGTGCYLAGARACVSFSGSQVSGQAPRTPGSLIAPATLDFYFTNAAAQVATYGAGCPTSVGIPAMDTSDLAWVCLDGSALDEYQLGVTGAPAGAPGAFLVALGPTAVPLSVIGTAATCFLLVDPIMLNAPFTANASGRGSFALQIPASAGLIGASLFSQAAIIDFALSSPLKLATSNAARHTVGGI